MRRLSPALTIAVLAVALALLIACEEEGAGSSRPDPTLSPSAAVPQRAEETGASKPSPTLNLGSILPPPPSPPMPPDTTPATVTDVVDGDTIDVLIDGEEFTVRYVGVNTPETVDPRRPVQCYGQEASDKNKELVSGRAVGLEKDISETDEFGRLLRYVWLDRGVMVNATLVAEGYAESTAYPPDVRHQDWFDGLEAAAREQGLGLWGDVCAETPTATFVTSGCEYSTDGAPAIKGNISQNTGERIYHVPGQENYEATRINEAAGERWFCTESEAILAGWRKSQR